MSLERLALIGARGHFNTPLRALPRLPQVRIVGVADGAPDDPATPLLKWCAEHGHEPRAFADYREMLDQTRPDAVVVCGPFNLHAQMSLDAIERGVHVFAEKPIALTLTDLDRLRESHRRHPSVHVAGMMNSRYDPGFYTACKLINDGAVGDVRLLNARKSYKLGTRPPYYHDRATYGGTIQWVGSHAIDWVLSMCPHAIRTIVAQHSAEQNDGNGSMERAAQCCFGFEGGRMATVSIDLFRPANAPTHGDDWIRVVGTEGVLEARPAGVLLVNGSNDGTQPVSVGCDRDVFQDFVDHVNGVRPGLIDAGQTFMLTEVCLQALLSADRGGAMITFTGPMRFT